MVDKTQRDVEGIKWGESTVCNVTWTGVPLRDLLLYAGVQEDYEHELHVCFASHIPCQDDDYYGVSIPLEKAMDETGDVILAYNVSMPYSFRLSTFNLQMGFMR